MGIFQWLDDHVVTPVGEFLGWAAEQVHATIEERKRFVAAMVELGWPPTKWLDQDTQQVVLTALGTRGIKEAKQDLERALVNHFTKERLDALLVSWKTYPQGAKRAHILAQVVAGHEQGLFALTTPVIHAQIDGMLSEAFRIRGKGAAVPWKHLGKLLRSSPWPGNAHLGVDSFVRQKLLVEFDRGSPLESEHSRHAIAHGADTTYATAENSLKAILLLDYVVWAISDLRLVDGKVYHRPECVAIEAPFERLGIVRNFFDAAVQVNKQGLTPCPRCNAHQFLATQPSPPMVTLPTQVVSG